jgi:hypothetical protein
VPEARRHATANSLLNGTLTTRLRAFATFPSLTEKGPGNYWGLLRTPPECFSPVFRTQPRHADRRDQVSENESETQEKVEEKRC